MTKFDFCTTISYFILYLQVSHSKQWTHHTLPWSLWTSAWMDLSHTDVTATPFSELTSPTSPKSWSSLIQLTQLLSKLTKIQAHSSLLSKTQRLADKLSSLSTWSLWILSTSKSKKPSIAPSSPSTLENSQRSARSLFNYQIHLLLPPNRTAFNWKLKVKPAQVTSTFHQTTQTERRSKPSSKWKNQ